MTHEAHSCHFSTVSRPAGAARDARLVAVVVTYNSARWYRNCLRSLLADAPAPAATIVIDNASTDGTANGIAAEFPDVRLVRHPANLGASTGWNRGVEEALALDATHVLLLNPDTIICKGLCRGLLEMQQAHPDYGVLGPVQYDYDGTEPDPFFAKMYPTEEREGLPDPFETETVIGAAMLVARKVFTTIGGFDPTYFVYGEEDDFCRRARYHGFRVGITRRAAVRHWHTALHENGHGFLCGRRLRNYFIYLLKNPEEGSRRRLDLFLQHALITCQWGALKRGRIRQALRVAGALVRLAPSLPWILRTRRLEKTAPCHLRLPVQ
jgi:GT2 family glycosyltransferase